MKAPSGPAHGGVEGAAGDGVQGDPCVLDGGLGQVVQRPEAPFGAALGFAYDRFALPAGRSEEQPDAWDRAPGVEQVQDVDERQVALRDAESGLLLRLPDHTGDGGFHIFAVAGGKVPGRRGEGAVRVALAQEDGSVADKHEVGADDAAAAVVARLADFHQRKCRVMAPTELVRIVVGVQGRRARNDRPVDRDAGVLLDEHVRTVGRGRGITVGQGVDSDARAEGGAVVALPVQDLFGHLLCSQVAVGPVAVNDELVPAVAVVSIADALGGQPREGGTADDRGAGPVLGRRVRTRLSPSGSTDRRQKPGSAPAR